MKWVLLIAGGSILVLAVISSVIPPVPVWLGGLIGVLVFLGVGKFLVRFID